MTDVDSFANKTVVDANIVCQQVEGAIQFVAIGVIGAAAGREWLALRKNRD